jgi:hypothetical protein
MSGSREISGRVLARATAKQRNLVLREMEDKVTDVRFKSKSLNLVDG